MSVDGGAAAGGGAAFAGACASSQRATPSAMAAPSDEAVEIREVIGEIVHPLRFPVRAAVPAVIVRAHREPPLREADREVRVPGAVILEAVYHK